MPTSPIGLDVVHHRVSRFKAPYLLIVQHHDIPASTLLVAPVTLPLPGDADVLAPSIVIGGSDDRSRLLDISVVPRCQTGRVVAAATAEADAILSAIGIILHGYAAGRPWGYD